MKTMKQQENSEGEGEVVLNKYKTNCIFDQDTQESITIPPPPSPCTDATPCTY